MAFLNPWNLTSQEMSEKDMTYKYWYEFLFPMVLDLEIEVWNEVLDKNYDFYKLCENFKWNIMDLKTYIESKWYRNILIMNDINFINYLRNNLPEITSWLYNFSYKNWVYIVAIKCSPENILIKNNDFKLRIKQIWLS